MRTCNARAHLSVWFAVSLEHAKQAVAKHSKTHVCNTGAPPSRVDPCLVVHAVYIPLARTELLGVPFRAESSRDDSVLTKPASEDRVKAAEGVAGADSSSSSRLRG